jgi:class 3 adenylate cyclase
MPISKISVLFCLLACLLCWGRQDAFAQEELLELANEDRYLYCDDVVEVCPIASEIAALLVKHEFYTGEGRVFVAKGYIDLFRTNLSKTFALGELQSIWLEGNYKTLPPELAQQTKLQKLVIEDDSIAEIPNFVQKLTVLEGLYFENTRILPVGISNFKNIKLLRIRAPRVARLPQDVGKAQTLQTLVVLENGIGEMPAIIGDLRDLRELYWTGGKLTALPATIGKLKNLKELYLPTNQIMDLPAEIGGLENLEVLSLFANRLRNLPPQIIQLKNLKKLDLRGNTFEDLEITPELYAFFLRLNNGNNEVIGFLMDKFRMQEKLDFEQSERARERAEKEQALQKARAIEAEVKRQAEEARANKAEAMRQAEEAKRIAEQLRGQKLEQMALLEKEKANEAETKRLKAENGKKNAEIAAQKSELQTEQAKRNLSLLVFGVFFMLIVGAMIWNNLRKQRRLNQQLEAQKQEIERQKAKADELLLNILPEEVAHELKEKGYTEVKYFESASVLFADVQGFSKLAKELSPQDLIKELDLCFTAFDEIAEKYNLERIKTIGDNYMCAGGVPNANQSHPYDIVRAAIEMQRWMTEQEECRLQEGKQYWKIRIGIHTGELVAGVIGKTKFAYDLWGDTVNLASRMETAGESGKINISEDTYLVIKDSFLCVPRGVVEAKNIGMVKAYFVEGTRSSIK